MGRRVRSGFLCPQGHHHAPGAHQIEEHFRRAWETVTLALLAQRGARGSRLHRTSDGLWVAYAQWPDEAHWRGSQDAPSIDPAASEEMRAAIDESLEPILLHPVADHLVPG